MKTQFLLSPEAVITRIHELNLIGRVIEDVRGGYGYN